MKKALIFTAVLFIAIWLPSCYKNYYDISEDTLKEINSVSFRSDVVPIMTSGACGCHNNGTLRQVKFSEWDTASKKTVIYYETILARASGLYDMAKGGNHPGEGSIFFTPSQADLVIKWYDQGAEDDGSLPPVSVEVTYAKNIQPINATICSGPACHGGKAVVMDYTYMKANEAIISPMMKSGGTSHPGGSFPVSATTSATFLAWYAQGAKP